MARRFIVEESFWELFPDARIGVVVCRGLDNSGDTSDEVLTKLRTATDNAGQHVPNEEFSSNDIVQTWRKAFQRFPGKKGARSSVEAMLKRASSGKGVGSINPLVDIYNAVSLMYAVPIGGEDLAAVEGDIRLTRATGGEDFVTLGSDTSEPAVAGEVIYADDTGAICRNWNWREAVRTMLTNDTTDAVMVVEAVDGARLEAFQGAVELLTEAIPRNLGGTTRHVVHTKDDPEVSLGDE